MVLLGSLSIRKSSKEFNIPFATLRNKVKELHSKRSGGQPRLSLEAEKVIVEMITELTDWRIPLSGLEIRFLVKDYLDRRNVVDRVFTDNLPGHDWLGTFKKRNNLTHRIADNLKASRAAVNEEIIGNYFVELEKSLSGIPPSNIVNYDETNMTDDPGSKTVIVRRGHKRRVERIVTLVTVTDLFEARYIKCYYIFNMFAVLAYLRS